MATAGSGKKFFEVTATGFEIIVPEAAYSENVLSVRTGELSVAYDILPQPGGGKANIALKGMMLLDNDQNGLLTRPNELHLDVFLPPDGIGSDDDQAMRVSIEMGDADFAIAKAQYAQIIVMLDKNIGDDNLYLRSAKDQTKEQRSITPEVPDTPSLTHAGGMVVENPKRIYATIKLARLSLALFGSDHEDPLIRLTTDETKINAELFPNGEKLSTKISMKNLECFDQRIKSVGREYRSMIYQEESAHADAPSSLMLIEYESGESIGTTLKVSVGTPRIVFIPDAISDTMQFFARDGGPPSNDGKHDDTDNRSYVETSHVEIKDDGPGSEVETKYVVEKVPEKRVSHYSVSFTTSDCYFIFVDLGSTSVLQGAGLNLGTVQSATETFVVKGIMDCRLQCEMNDSNDIETARAEFHGDGLEAYTAFGGVNDALQIVEPARISVYVNTKRDEEMTQNFDLRIASVTPIDVYLSMKNVALLNAIISGITDCFDNPPPEKGGDRKELRMTEKDADRIEKLASALEGDDDTVGTGFSRTSSLLDHSEVEPPSRSTISGKITLPEMGLTVVNDLQGLDDALFRVAVHNLVASCTIDEGTRDHRVKDPFTAFSGSLNCSLSSDYFDDSSRSWKHLLLKPWEITLRTQRGMNSKVSARVPSTTCDIESFTCQVGFTEQFLMSLASANKMWAVYSAAISSAMESTNQIVASERLRRSIAASAARTLVTVLPYVIENHCGKDIKFVVHGDRETKSVCADKTMEYFRFTQPKGKGFGGLRLYGQDRKSQNALSIFVGDHSIYLPDIDSMVASAKESHVLPTQEVIFVHVVKEGKAVVSLTQSTVFN